MKKLTIAKIELGPTPADCRVILSNGDELGSLTRIAPGEVTHGGGLTVSMTAVLRSSEA